MQNLVDIQGISSHFKNVSRGRSIFLLIFILVFVLLVFLLVLVLVLFLVLFFVSVFLVLLVFLVFVLLLPDFLVWLQPFRDPIGIDKLDSVIPTLKEKKRNGRVVDENPGPI